VAQGSVRVLRGRLTPSCFVLLVCVSWFGGAVFVQWTHNRGHISHSNIFAKPISSDTITETCEQFIDPTTLMVEGWNKDMNLSKTWVSGTDATPGSPKGSAAGSPTWRNSANLNSSEILSGHG
jgi:hypothetical protein